MAADFVTGIVKRAYLGRIDQTPMGVAAAANAAGNVECAAHPMLLQNGGAIRIRRIRHIVESETHERRGVAHHQRL
jgi:hypothetical protein